MLKPTCECGKRKDAKRVETRRILQACLCLAALRCVCAAAIAAPGKPIRQASSLLAKATRVLTVPPDQSSSAQNTAEVDSPWLSARALLHYGKGRRIFRYDLNTKTDDALPALTAQVASSPAYARFLLVSPSGKWVLWGESGNNPFFVADVAGRHRFQWPGNGGLSEPYWCADGHRWVEMKFSGGGATFNPKVEYTRALLHDANAPSASVPLPAIPSRMQGLDILSFVGPNQIIARAPDAISYGNSKNVSSAAADGSLTMSFTEVRTPRATQQISVWKLGQAAPLSHWTIHLPGVASEVTVSPRGNRVAWLLSPVPSKTLPTTLREETASLWVSRLDGGEMRQIGSVTKRIPPLDVRRLQQTLLAGVPLDAATQKKLSLLSGPSQVRWLPGGRAISFQNEGALWVVPVE